MKVGIALPNLGTQVTKDNILQTMAELQDVFAIANADVPFTTHQHFIA